MLYTPMQRKMIQVRNVPERIHRTLKTRAAQSGTTLSDYLLAELTRIAERPTLEEIVARIAARPSVYVDSAAAVRAEREGRR
jgi:plasmid stability protein